MANILNQYGNGVNSSQGQNHNLFYWYKSGLEAANNKKVLGQFVAREFMQPKHTGFEFVIDRYFNGYDRAFQSAEWAKNGWLTNRDIFEVSGSVDDSLLPEAAGKQNQRTLRKESISTSLREFGAMIEYTDRISTFSEDQWITRFYRDLGYWAGQTYEDLLLLGMLQTPTRAYSGLATSIGTVGTGVALDGSTDAIALAQYDMFMLIEKKLKAYRAKKNTKIVTGSDKIDTKVVSPAYYALVGSDVIFNLKTLLDPHDMKSVGKVAFLTPEYYAAAGSLAQGEAGSLVRTGVRFIELERMVVYKGGGAPLPIDETNGEYLDGSDIPLYEGSLKYTTFATVQDVLARRNGLISYIHSVGGVHTVEEGTTVPADNGGDTFKPILSYFDVYPIVFPTEDSFASVGLQGAGKLKWIQQTPEQAKNIDTNPFGNRGWLAVKFWHASLIIREENLLVAFVCATNS